MAPSAIRIDGLSHWFNRQKVLDAISMNIRTGSIYGFLGPNGAGKTTTLRLLLGLLAIQDGSISIFGFELKESRINILRRIGSMIEQPSLYLHLSGTENLEIFRISYQADKNRIPEVLKIVGLSDAGKKKVRSYSLGMKQRLAIAIALLHDPELLIMDEPVNGLDPGGIIEMRDLIIRLNREEGKTILVSSHLLSEVEKIATDLAIVHKGKIIFQGTLDQLQQVKSTNSVIEIEVNDPQKAMQLLENNFSIQHLNGKILVDFVSPQDTARLNALLVQHGIEVYKLNVDKHNLEDLFVKMISQ